MTEKEREREGGEGVGGGGGAVSRHILKHYCSATEHMHVYIYMRWITLKKF